MKEPIELDSSDALVFQGYWESTHRTNGTQVITAGGETRLVRSMLSKMGVATR